MNLKPVLIVLVLAGLGFGGYLYLSQPVPLPNIALKDESGNPLGFKELIGDRDHLMLVVLMPGCTLSQFTVAQLKGLQARLGRVALVGLAGATNAGAKTVGEQLGTWFPIYGLSDTLDPFATQALIEALGSGSRVYGGTVAMVDRKQRLLFSLSQEQVKELPDRLTELKY